MENEMTMKQFGLLVLFTCSSFAAVASETSGPPLDTAVRVFLGQTVSQPGAAAASQASTPSQNDGQRKVVVVKPGESLVRIVRAHFKGSPFRDDFIYKAFVQLNPEAFPRKTHHIVNAGASLQVPTMADLMAMVEGEVPPAHAGPSASTSARHSGTQRQHWVRFP
jgi:Tfp pilus assembly protein FimV